MVMTEKKRDQAVVLVSLKNIKVPGNELPGLRIKVLHV